MKIENNFTIVYLIEIIFHYLHFEKKRNEIFKKKKMSYYYYYY
jgi:hypothetical protein